MMKNTPTSRPHTNRVPRLRGGFIAAKVDSKSLSLAITLALLSLVLTGCHKQIKAAAAPVPPPFIGEGAPAIGVPPPTHVTPDATLEYPETPAPEPAEKPKPVRKPVPAKPTAPPQTATPPPATTANPSVNILGTLSTGGEVSPALRDATNNLLRTIHQRMDNTPVDRQAQHHDQFERVRNFVHQADEAWKTGDVEGARTLATKARVLLDEIQQ